jgi:hypothetical protein
MARVTSLKRTSTPATFKSAEFIVRIAAHLQLKPQFETELVFAQQIIGRDGHLSYFGPIANCGSGPCVAILPTCRTR